MKIWTTENPTRIGYLLVDSSGISRLALGYEVDLQQQFPRRFEKIEKELDETDLDKLQGESIHQLSVGLLPSGHKPFIEMDISNRVRENPVLIYWDENGERSSINEMTHIDNIFTGVRGGNGNCIRMYCEEIFTGKIQTKFPQESNLKTSRDW